MAQSINKLSVRAIASKSRKGRYADGGGLYLQVGPTGSKSWLFRYQMDNRARQMGLGPLNTVTLAEARELAGNCRRMLLDGVDPISKRNTDRQASKVETAKT